MLGHDHPPPPSTSSFFPLSDDGSGLNEDLPLPARSRRRRKVVTEASLHDTPKGRQRKPKPRKPCKYYLEGNCTKGDACTFDHPTLLHCPTDQIPTPLSLPSPEITVKATQKRIKSTRPPLPSTLDRTYSGARATFGPGLELLAVTTSVELTCLQISNLPRSFTLEALNTILGPFQGIDYTKLVDPRAVQVKFNDWEQAKEARKELNGQILEGQVLSCRLEAEHRDAKSGEARIPGHLVAPSAESTGCPICLCPPTNATKLDCGHEYCTACLKAYLISSEAFPITCAVVGQADTRCRSRISLHIVRRVLSAQQEKKLLDVAFTSYVQRHAQDIHYCPTPDCDWVYRPQSDGNLIRCESCANQICTTCNVLSHSPVSCADYAQGITPEFLAFLDWKETHDVKSCPRCHADIEKIDGCNHMVCGSCQAHMCWKCLEVFEESGLTYEHIRSERHGILNGWGEEVEDDDDNEGFGLFD